MGDTRTFPSIKNRNVYDMAVSRKYDPDSGWTIVSEPSAVVPTTSVQRYRLPTDAEIHEHFNGVAMGAKNDAERSVVTRHREAAIKARDARQVELQRGTITKPADQTVSNAQVSSALIPNTTVANSTARLAKRAVAPPSVSADTLMRQQQQCKFCAALINREDEERHREWHIDKDRSFGELRSLTDKLFDRVEALERRVSTGRSMVKRPRPKDAKP